MRVRSRLATKVVPFVSLILEKMFGASECDSVTEFLPLIQRHSNKTVWDHWYYPSSFYRVALSTIRFNPCRQSAISSLRTSHHFMPPSHLLGCSFHLTLAPLTFPGAQVQSSKLKSSTISPQKPFLTSLGKYWNPLTFYRLFLLYPILLWIEIVPLFFFLFPLLITESHTTPKTHQLKATIFKMFLIVLWANWIQLGSSFVQ